MATAQHTTARSNRRNDDDDDRSNRRGGAESISTREGQSKAAIARQIFNDMGDAPRKEVVKEFVDRAGLTEKGAATYYQNFRKEAGLVQSRVEAARRGATASK